MINFTLVNMTKTSRLNCQWWCNLSINSPSVSFDHQPPIDAWLTIASNAEQMTYKLMQLINRLIQTCCVEILLLSILSTLDSTKWQSMISIPIRCIGVSLPLCKIIIMWYIQLQFIQQFEAIIFWRSLNELNSTGSCGRQCCLLSHHQRNMHTCVQLLIFIEPLYSSITYKTT